MGHPQITDVVARLRQQFDAGTTKPLAWRIQQLKALRRMLVENTSVFETALAADLGKNATESFLVESGFVIGEIDNTLKHLRSWLRPKRTAVPGSVMPARAWTMREPVGVVLVIAPWNYPLQLSLVPVIGALAAGNAVVLKPSELAQETAEAMARLVPHYLDERAVAVVTGGVEETTTLLAERFDHIFYTGNGRVGRIVLEAAAKHLTPTTLELGGKSPVYVDDTVDLEAAADRIVWGKFMNAGQTCVAPDYLLATSEVTEKLVPMLTVAIKRMYGDDPSSSADYGRIANDAQFSRLTGLLGDGTLVCGGDHDATSRFLSPTVVSNVPRDAEIMQQEIFGPILPIVTVSDADDAISLIRSGDKPLALYVFSASKRVRRRFLSQTSSGAVGFGVTAAHLAVPGLPFGGVGDSGMGAYHGERSVATFSHEKAVLSKPLAPDTMRLIYPPYTEKKDRFIRGLLRKLG